MNKIMIFSLVSLCLFTTSCNNINLESQNSNYVITNEYSGEITTKIHTTETMVSVAGSNIKEINLDLLKNNKYPFPQKDYNFDSDNILSNGNKIIADKNLYLEEPSGERTVIIELPDKETNMSVHLYGMIDENCFCYGIYKEFIRNVGIYDLSTDKDFRLDSGYSLEKKINNNLFFSKGIPKYFV